MSNRMNSVKVFRALITLAMFVIAIVLAYVLWSHYMYSPWTRDGRIRAYVTKVAPDVSGLVTEVKVVDNEKVHRGQTLMMVDTSRYQLALADAQSALNRARANYRQAVSQANSAKATVEAKRSSYEMYADRAERRRHLSSTAISREDLSDAISTASTAQAEYQQALQELQEQRDAVNVAQVAIQQAQVSVNQAQLNLDRTEVKAATDGYVTNVNVRVGDYADAGQQQMALIDSNSFYIYGYFEETKLPHLKIGDKADIRLIAGGTHVEGRVTGIARGIGDTENTNSENQLLDVNPTFDWVRLAQRVPVRIEIDPATVPKDTVLFSGMTATVNLKPSDSDDGEPAVSVQQ
ncbi:HlyD family secretion protein [Carnimonas bestiolae]|uniref:HlyD family secretion protein n=1 Tax=Carnimonas bestiolae TaxID=3402172 RepID=UPI003F4A94F2